MVKVFLTIAHKLDKNEKQCVWGKVFHILLSDNAMQKKETMFPSSDIKEVRLQSVYSLSFMLDKE